MSSLLTAPQHALAARIAADASGTERAIEPRRHLSFSQLNTFLDCGEKFRLKYVVGAPQETGGAMIAGRAVHETIEESELRGWWQEPADAEPDPFFAADSEGIEFFRARLDAQVKEAGGAERIRWGGRQIAGQREDYPWWITNGAFMLRRYAASRQAFHESGWRSAPGGTEMRVTVPLEGIEQPLLGYIDKFLMQEVDLDSGEIMPEPAIVDWKTGKVGSINPMQFATYATLLELGPQIVTSIGLAVFLRAGDADRRVQPVRFAPIVPRMKEVYASLVEGVESGRQFVPNPHAWCSSCEVRESCWYFMGTTPPGEEES